VKDALTNSFIVAIPNAFLATAFGTMAALGLQRVGTKLRLAFDGLTYISVIVPEIVIALSTLILFASGIDVIRSVFGVRLILGYPTIIAAHVLFNTSLVLLLVRARLSGMDRTLVEASQDLFATPWRTFRQITFPQLLPAIVAGFLLSFTFSFDDYVITQFVSGPGSQTLPLFIFGQTRQGVTPLTNGTTKTPLEIKTWSDEMEAGSLMKDPEKRAYFKESCSKLGLNPEMNTTFDWLEADDRESVRRKSVSKPEGEVIMKGTSNVPDPHAIRRT
jgi:spermidine/putrescine transport system permease protein